MQRCRLASLPPAVLLSRGASLAFASLGGTGHRPRLTFAFMSSALRPLRPLKVLLRAGVSEARAYSTTTNSSSPQDVRNAVHHLEDTVSLNRVRGLANTLELPTAPESHFETG